MFKNLYNGCNDLLTNHGTWIQTNNSMFIKYWYLFMKQNKVNNDTKYCMEQKILLKYSLKLARKQRNIHNKYFFEIKLLNKTFTQ